MRFACVILVMALVAGCNGWPAAVPRAKAEQWPEKYPAYQAVQTEIVTVGERRWLVQPARVEVRGVPLRPVVSAEHKPIFATAWDEPPHSLLYAQVSDTTWRQVGRID